jgi:hypothetical protein
LIVKRKVFIQHHEVLRKILSHLKSLLNVVFFMLRTHEGGKRNTSTPQIVTHHSVLHGHENEQSQAVSSPNMPADQFEF